MASVLIIDDNEDLAGDLQSVLQMRGYSVSTAHTGESGLRSGLSASFDLIILDWELPDISGIDVCKQFRANAVTAPILMLTGNALVSHKEAGLDAGADDYLVKPFVPKVLLARLEALQRRAGRPLHGNVLKHGTICLDPASFLVTKNEKPIRLVPKEFAVLEFFMRNPGHVFSAEELIERIWSSDEEVGPETLRTYLKNLRKKLDEPDQPSSIENIHGRGYRLSSPDKEG